MKKGHLHFLTLLAATFYLSQPVWAEGEKEDTEERQLNLRRYAALQGDPQEQYELGEKLWQKGEDEDLARERKDREAGREPATTTVLVGNYFWKENTELRQTDKHKEGIFWIKVAADAGHPEAQYDLAFKYHRQMLDQEEVSDRRKSHELAVSYMIKAALNGDKYAHGYFWDYEKSNAVVPSFLHFNTEELALLKVAVKKSRKNPSPSRKENYEKYDSSEKYDRYDYMKCSWSSFLLDRLLEEDLSEETEEEKIASNKRNTAIFEGAETQYALGSSLIKESQETEPAKEVSEKFREGFFWLKVAADNEHPGAAWKVSRIYRDRKFAGIASRQLSNKYLSMALKGGYRKAVKYHEDLKSQLGILNNALSH